MLPPNRAIVFKSCLRRHTGARRLRLQCLISPVVPHKELVIATKSPIPGFDSHGPASPAVLTAAFDELSGV
jgi:hypothetical protein